jgi:hypothetical protein
MMLRRLMPAEPRFLQCPALRHRTSFPDVPTDVAKQANAMTECECEQASHEDRNRSDLSGG